MLRNTRAAHAVVMVFRTFPIRTAAHLQPLVWQANRLAAAQQGSSGSRAAAAGTGWAPRRHGGHAHTPRAAAVRAVAAASPPPPPLPRPAIAAAAAAAGVAGVLCWLLQQRLPLTLLRVHCQGPRALH